MSVTEDILDHFGPEEVAHVTRVHTKHHGQDAVRVLAELGDGRTVEGTFTTEARKGFGGIEFSQRKDITGLMISKIEAVLRGSAEADYDYPVVRTGPSA